MPITPYNLYYFLTSIRGMQMDSKPINVPEQHVGLTEKKMSVGEQLHFAEANLDFLLEWVSRFDNKSYVVLGINTGMLGVLATFAPAANQWNPLMTVFTVLSIGLLSTSLLFVYLGNYPRLKGPNNSLFYFGSICKQEVNKYVKDFSKRTPAEHLRDLLEQCHRNSEILNQKFSYLGKAYKVLFIGVIFWAITIYLFRSIPPV